jgi:putative membrane protein
MNTYYLLSSLSIAGLVLMPIAAPAQTQPTSPNSVDRQFVQQAALANEQEIKDAQAEQNSPNPNIRLFAQTMLRDHGKSLSQLAADANELSLAYPRSGLVATTQGQPSKSTGQNAMASALPPQQYMQQQVQAHQKTIALYENEMKNGGSEMLRTYAGATLPVLKNHLAMAQQFLRVGRITPEPAPTNCVGAYSC